MNEIRINNVLYSTPIQKVTQAEYDALGDAKNTNGVLYAITDGESSSSGGGTSKPVELTKAQYEALGDSVLNDNILYAITDGDDYTAKNLAYDDSETQLGVNNVQDAISEQNKKMSFPDITSYKGTFASMSKDSVAYAYYWTKSAISDTFSSDEDGLHVCHFIRTKSDEAYNVVIVYTTKKIVRGFYTPSTNTLTWYE